MTRPDFYTAGKRKKYNAKYYASKREARIKQMREYRKKNRDILNQKARDKYWAQFLDNSDALIS
jgi:hypothetical protein